MKISSLSRFSLALTSLVSMVILSACGDDNSGGCSDDNQCLRGQVCVEGACTVVDCRAQGIFDCPEAPKGSVGRTCLQDELVCSQKECGEDRPECPMGKACVETGNYRWSCAMVQPMAMGGMLAPVGGVPAMTGGAVASGGVMSMEPMPTGGAGGGAEPNVQICSTCSNDIDCTELGVGARCTAIGASGSFCTVACGENLEPCGAGFTCLAQVNQCVPVNFDCTKCPARACADGEVCDVDSGLCTQPKTACQACGDNSNCADGLTCATLGMNNVCVPKCDDANPCFAGTTCTGGACIPDNNGPCDACGGTCMGATPACKNETAMCVACVVDGDCPEEGTSCDAATNTCVAGEQCLGDAQCASVPGRPVCFQGRCVECLQSSDCPARSECSGSPNWQCTSMPCTGVTCQTGTSCDDMTGRCVKPDGTPGCVTDMDCANPDTMGCNAQTGQCYYDAYDFGEAACDLGGDAVCAPGSMCVVNQIFMVGACQCRIDPMTMMGTGCFPGQTCIQDPLTPDETDGGCINSGL